MGFLHIILPAGAGEDALHNAEATFTVRRSGLVEAEDGAPCQLVSLSPERDWSRYGGWPLHWIATQGILDTHKYFPLFQALSRDAGARPVGVVELDDIIGMATVAVFRRGVLETFHSVSDTPAWCTPVPPLVPPHVKAATDSAIVAAAIPEASLRKNPTRRVPGWDRFLERATLVAATWRRDGIKPQQCPNLFSIVAEFLVTEEDFDEKPIRARPAARKTAKAAKPSAVKTKPGAAKTTKKSSAAKATKKSGAAKTTKKSSAAKTSAGKNVAAKKSATKISKKATASAAQVRRTASKKTAKKR
ncbi:Alginate regulatory protein AlgP [Minicystis rosea]|nr:Alginate regulatory protein AlgP [Minicystis rosea]